MIYNLKNTNSHVIIEEENTSNKYSEVMLTEYATQEGDIGMLEMQLQHTFDEKLKYKLKVKQEDERARKNYLIHRKYLTKIKFIVVFFYMFIAPFIEIPYRCEKV